MPAPVLSCIKEKALHEFPVNFAAQKFFIDTQLRDCRFLETYSASSVSPDMIEKVKHEAASEFPDDFSTQKLIVETRMETFVAR